MTRILVMEDDPDQAIMLRNTLTHAGCIVDVTYSGTEAWLMLQQRRFDILIADMQVKSAPESMKSEGGLALIIRIRQSVTENKGSGWMADLKIIAITGSHNYGQERLDRAAIFGADQTLIKPVSKLQILTAVNTVTSDTSNAPA